MASAAWFDKLTTIGEVMVRLHVQRADPAMGEKAGNDQNADQAEDDPKRCDRCPVNRRSSQSSGGIQPASRIDQGLWKVLVIRSW